MPSVAMPRPRASSFRFCVISQVPLRLGLAVAYPLGKEPDGRLEVTLAGRLDDNSGNAHSESLS